MSKTGVSIIPREGILGGQEIAQSPGGTESPTIKSMGVEEQKHAALKEAPRIITSKKWVLPPRPKPGRKPSVETPASKRKAQNRAAQRAFRERRATRAQELEEKLAEVEKVRDYREMEYVNRINQLTSENKTLNGLVEKLKQEINQIKKISLGASATESLESHSRGTSRNFSQISWQIGESTSQFSSQSPNSDISGERSSVVSSTAVQQISPASSTLSSPQNYDVGSLAPHMDGDHSRKSSSVSDSNKLECGICMKDNCVCESIGVKETPILKKLHETIDNYVPTGSVSLLSRKRKADYEDREIDFTKKFARSKIPDFKRATPSLVSMRSKSSAPVVPDIETYPEDRCGFCTDDTFCLCKEAQMDTGKRKDSESGSTLGEPSNSLPPIQNKSTKIHPLPVMHPGPSVDISNITNLSPGAVPTVLTQTRRSSSAVRNDREPSVSKEAAACTGNPGTCEQCMKDPMSNLFCTTIASREKQNKSEKQPLERSNLGANVSGSSSSSSNVNSPDENNSDSPSKSESLFIPCADAYRTLSLHKKFNSVDFGSLVGKLTTRGMQVEVQSVANVLRQLDRRLYS